MGRRGSDSRVIEEKFEKIVNWPTQGHVACGQEYVNLYSGATHG